MAYEIDHRLVIGVASSAVFDLSDSDAVFRNAGEEAYREFQRQHVDRTLAPGTAFSFVRRLLSLNDLSPDPVDDPLIEVVLLSRNDPDTGLRVMNSIAHHRLAISRAIFTQGRAPCRYIPALNIALFLSAHRQDVVDAIAAGLPAGHVLESRQVDDEDDDSLRIAFDFDGVLADDASETVMQTCGLGNFHDHERRNVMQPHNPGPLKEFLVRVAGIQAVEEQRRRSDASYRQRLRVSLVTARSAPAHQRALNTLKSWGVMANEAFFLGGIDKARVLGVLRPHIFFDDQSRHLLSTSSVVPSVHIPFGITNRS